MDGGVPQGQGVPLTVGPLVGAGPGILVAAVAAGGVQVLLVEVDPLRIVLSPIDLLLHLLPRIYLVLNPSVMRILQH